MNIRHTHTSMEEFDLENPLPPSNEKIPSLFHIEVDHMPSKAYTQNLISQPSHLSVRNEIASSILNYSREFDPFLSYLAINYMDRFLSTQSFRDWKPWILKLVSISCISLALKMRKAEFFFSDLMDDGGVTFNSHTIERMEMLILGALNWRMRSVNPFSFTNYFISFSKLNDNKMWIQSLKSRANDIILKAQNDIKLLEFNPSIVSASALLTAAYELLPVQFPSFRDSICSCPYVNKGKLQNCYEMMGENAVSSITCSESNENGKSGIEIIKGQKMEGNNNSSLLQLSQTHQ